MPWVLLLPELPEFLVVLGGIALCALCLYLARGIAGGIGGGGLVGTISNWLANSVVIPIANGISHYVGQAVAGPDKAIGTALHSVARFLDWTGATFLGIGAFSVSVARLIGEAVTHGELAHLERRLRGLLRSTEGAIAGEVGRAIHHLTRLVNSVAQGVYPRIGALEHDVTKVIPREIGNLRKGTIALEDSIIKLWAKVRSLPTTADITTAVAAAIAALGLAGLDLLRCAESGALFSKRGCGLWNLLDDALGLFFDALVVASICEVIPLLEEAFSAIASPLIGTVAAAGAGLCNPSDAQAPALAVPSLSLPANPGVSLNLP